MHPLRIRAFLCVFASLLAAGCQGGSGGGTADPDADPTRAAQDQPKRVRIADDRPVEVSELTSGEMASFQVAWKQFLSHSPLWRVSREKWIDRGGAAPYVLSENLFRYFWAASFQGRTEEVNRVALNAARVGEPAVAYFAKPLAEDRVRLSKPLEVKEEDPNNPGKQRRRKVHFLTIDDTTRRDAAKVLAAIGPAAVPTLSRREILRDARPMARRYAARALGHIGTAEAIEALAGMYRGSSDWMDRSAAVQALGIALKSEPSARPLLEGALQDDDKFVREQAQKALAGQIRDAF